MTKIQAMEDQIALREKFYEVDYTDFQYICAMFRMMFSSKELIVISNKDCEFYIKEYGTAKVMRLKVEGV